MPSYVKRGPFRVGLTIPGQFNKPVLYSDAQDKEREAAGVGIFMLPTQTPYHIDIRFEKATINHLYEITSIKVGPRKVSINNDNRIFYPSDTVVKGFQTGSNESFKFYSPSEYEKTNMGDKIPKDHNVSNVIEIRLQEYQKVNAPPMRSYSTFGGFGGYDNCADSFNESFPTGAGISDLGMGGFGTSAFGSFGLDPPGCASVNTYSSFSGGSTISGGAHVPHLKTVSFHGKTEQVGQEHVITLQLACDQPEDVKCYSNLQALLCSAGAGTIVKRYQDDMKKFEKVEAEMRQLEARLNTYFQIRKDLETKYEKEIKKLRELKPNETELLPASAYTTVLPHNAPEFVKKALEDVEKTESKSLLLTLS